MSSLCPSQKRNNPFKLRLLTGPLKFTSQTMLSKRKAKEMKRLQIPSGSREKRMQFKKFSQKSRSIQSRKKKKKSPIYSVKFLTMKGTLSIKAMNL